MSERVVRGGFTNMDTAEFRSFWFNPTELEIAVEVHYSKQPSLGGTGQRHHFNYVDNERIPVNFMVDRMALFSEMATQGETQNSVRGRVDEEIDDYIKFLWSLCYPVGLQSDPIRRAPPKVIFIWPKICNLQVRIMRESLRFQKFTNEGAPWRFGVSMELEVVNAQRLTSAMIRRSGFMRAGLGEE